MREDCWVHTGSGGLSHVGCEEDKGVINDIGICILCGSIKYLGLKLVNYQLKLHSG